MQQVPEDKPLTKGCAHHNLEAEQVLVVWRHKSPDRLRGFLSTCPCSAAHGKHFSPVPSLAASNAQIDSSAQIANAGSCGDGQAKHARA